MTHLGYDDAFRSAMIEDVMQAIVDGDLPAVRNRLGTCIKATIGFDALSSATQVTAASLKRMTGPSGTMSADLLLTILGTLQDGSGLRARVEVMDAV